MHFCVFNNEYFMDIESWIKTNEHNFGSIFEREFVDNVLVKINELDLNIVMTQYHFQDLDGKNRFCDFVIQEGDIKIAIEIDGYDKRNTGLGMNHNEFIDWQRRQAALTSYGWYVLRFANRDVRYEPMRCKRYIELLLREQRSKSQHQLALQNTIENMMNELQITQTRLGSSEDTHKLQVEINLLKNQLKFAKKSKPLNSFDKEELDSLIAKLEQDNKNLSAAHAKVVDENQELASINTQLSSHTSILGEENNIMKTTVWAFSFIIVSLIASATYFLTTNTKEIGITSTIEATLGDDNLQVKMNACDSAIKWNKVMDHINQNVVVKGVVAEYTYLPKINGQPTWINIGEKYPSKERLSVVIWGENRNNFGNKISKDLVNRHVCITGKVILRNNLPQIEIKYPQELFLQDK